MDWRRAQAARPPAPPVALAELTPSTRDFTAYLGAGRAGLAVIPLVVRRDPASGDVLDAGRDLAAFAAAADELDIPAIAIATEPTRCGGRLDDLATVARVATAPLLRYDCVADVPRLYESRAAGADAVLVPVAAAGDALAQLVDAARAMHVTVVAEVGDPAQCALALAAAAPVLALPSNALALAAHVPARCPLLAVEGVAAPADVARLRGVVDAVLVGRALWTASDPLARLGELVAAAETRP
jgi:indole-3-glycerol phosphate synthase